MLKSIQIRDFALIHSTTVHWTKGLNVLTGETGAGKSILIDALSAVLGGKFAASIIRPGGDKASIEASFEASPQVMAWLKQQELLDEDNTELIVAREITKSGSKVRINGTLVNNSLLGELRAMLLTVHAQHEARTLMTPASQMELLDGLGGEAHLKLLDKVRSLYARHKDLADELNSLTMSEEDRLRTLDFSRFQLGELVDAELLSDDEDKELEREISVLVNAIDLQSQSLTAQECLSGGDTTDDTCAMDLIQKAISEVEKSMRFDPSLAPVLETLGSGLAHVEEATIALRKYSNSLDTDPETLTELENRANLLSTIKRKYGPSLADARAKELVLAKEVERLENGSLEADKIREELSKLTSELKEKAEDLSARRKKLAKTLSSQVEGHLKDLGMEKCRFEIAFNALENCAPTGLDKLEFLITPNPGQPPQPLGKIASGGELSRIMLAIKTIFAKADQVSTVIFDEIDTGLSGRVLNAVRDKLAHLSTSHQILCITHQPIVAAVADNYLEVKKEHRKDDTLVTVCKLDDEMRLRSLAAMASGNDSEESLSFARSLLEQAGHVRPMA